MSVLWEHSFNKGGKVAADGEYRIRFAGDEDEELARAYVEADPDHAGRMSGRYWLEQEPGCESRILYRGNKPLFFFRLERAVRIHIQFAPAATAEERAELREALESGMAWLGMAMGAGGVRELLFDSVNRLLRRFVTGKLRFTAEPNTLKRTLVRLPPRH